MTGAICEIRLDSWAAQGPMRSLPGGSILCTMLLDSLTSDKGEGGGEDN
jgi:hypothetical protein